MRKMRMFEVRNDASEPEMLVEAIHNERGYRKLRKALARQYDIGFLEPDIQIVDVDLAGDRKLILQHRVINRVLWKRATPAPSCGTSPTCGVTRSCWSRSMRRPTRF